MRHINDDMDELFQKAAEGYPLRTDSSDWEAVNSKLLFKTNAERPVQPKRFRKSLELSVILSIFLFVPLSISNYLTYPHKVLKGGSSLVEEEKTISDGSNTKSAERELQQFSNETNNLIATEQIKLFPDKISNANKSVLHFSLNNVGPINPEEVIPIQTKSYSLSQTFWLQKQNIALSKDDLNQLNKRSIAQTNIQGSPESKKKELVKLTTPKNIYAGFIGTGELTNVHGQAFRKPGFNGGFVLGYNLNDKVQAEIGLIASRKYYYSDGKYASPNSLRDDGLAIGGVKIYSSMAEVPVLLRYNITTTNANKFFIAGGGVANFVHKEHYNYGYKKDGRDRKGGKVYNESVDNLFSNIQLSVGYEYKIGKAEYVRVEPYYRLPVNGTGAANFHVTSMGINIGLIKYFK